MSVKCEKNKKYTRSKRKRYTLVGGKKKRKTRKRKTRKRKRRKKKSRKKSSKRTYKQRGGNEPTDECPICFDEMNEDEFPGSLIDLHNDTKKKNHWFHKECVKRFLEDPVLEKSCPYCKENILPNIYKKVGILSPAERKKENKKKMAKNGTWSESKGYEDTGDSGETVPNIVYGECYNKCEKSWCGKITCGDPYCKKARYDNRGYPFSSNVEVECRLPIKNRRKIS